MTAREFDNIRIKIKKQLEIAIYDAKQDGEALSDRDMEYEIIDEIRTLESEYEEEREKIADKIAIETDKIIEQAAKEFHKKWVSFNNSLGHVKGSLNVQESWENEAVEIGRTVSSEIGDF